MQTKFNINQRVYLPVIVERIEVTKEGTKYYCVGADGTSGEFRAWIREGVISSGSSESGDKVPTTKV